MKKLNVVKQNSTKILRLLLSVGCLVGLLLSAAFNPAKSAAQSFEDFAPASPQSNPTTFSNHSSITIPDSGNASPYPSTISVNAAGSRISKVTVNIRALRNSRADDLDIYLLAPNGAGTVLMSDAGGTGFNDQTFFTFDQAAPTIIADNGPLPVGTGQTVVSRPVNYESFNVDVFDPPGPGIDSNFAANLDVFNGINPNGDWKLLVVDDTPGDNGEILGGWDLVLTFDELVVNATDDVVDTDGCTFAHCSLREAIRDVPAGGKVKFSTLFNTPQTINLQLQAVVPPIASLKIDKNLTIEGPGANLLTIAGANRTNNSINDRVFWLSNFIATVNLSGMTIAGGATSATGGGIYSAGILNLSKCVVAENTATNGGGVYGVFVNIYESSIVNNRATGTAAKTAAGLYTETVTVIRNSTISGNRNQQAAPNSAGGWYAQNDNLFGNSTLDNTTITNNYAVGDNSAGGLFSEGTTELANNIVAGNLNNSVTPDVGGVFESLNFNLIGNKGTVTAFSQPFDQTGTGPAPINPRLAPLNLYGGTTPTHALLGNSPAIDKGGVPAGATELAFDQRGFVRPVDVAAVPNAGNGSDIGSFEAGNTLIVNKTADTNDGSCSATDCSLREAIAAAPSGGVVYFSALFNTPQTITLSLGELAVNKNLTILGMDANLTTVSANSASRVFTTSSTGVFNVILQGLTIANGFPSGGAGGAISNNGNLTVSQCHVTNSLATLGGGIFNGNSGTLTVLNSTISNNTALNSDSGGGIDSRGALNVFISTVSGNSATVGSNNAGGIRFAGTTATTRARIENSTITNNTAAGTNSAGGLRRASGVIDQLLNTIVAGNANNATVPDVTEAGAANIITQVDLIGNPGTIVFSSDSRVGAPGNPLNPLLGPLADNGGPTPTHAIASASSPAINGPFPWFFNNALTDQRGLIRSFNHPLVPSGPDIGAFELQGTGPAPIAAATAADVTAAGGSSYIFTVTYTDDTAINVGTIGTGDVTVTGPNGFTATPAFVSVNNNTNGTPRTATYSFTPPGGIWDIGDNGAYTVLMQPNQVADNAGNFVGSGTIGSFAVSIPPACQYVLSPASPQSVPAAGGSLNVNVSAVASCAWTAASNSAFLTVTSGASGSGNGTVAVMIAANTGAARNGTLTIAGQTYTINQAAGPACPSAQPIAFGQTVGGALQSGDCTYTDNSFYDAYTFSGTAGQQISIAMSSAQFNSYLFLYQGNYPGGSVVAQDDNGGGGSNARIPANGFLTLPATGTYTILANSFAAGETGSYSLTLSRSAARAPFDFDGDGRTDISIFRPSNGQWWINRSASGVTIAAQFGQSTDIIAPGDFTGDGKTDIAFWRPSTGFWFILRSEDGSFFSFPFGTSGDVPVPADYDGDGRTDAAVFRPAAATWYIFRSSDGGTTITSFGAATDKPVPADYDGDGKTDVAIFRPSDGSWWFVRSSDNTFRVYSFGTGTDKPVPGDWTGDGKADVAIFRPSTNVWYVQRSEDLSFFSFPWGAAGDQPAPGDYDGNGIMDAAVFRPSTLTWYANTQTQGAVFTTFGATGDRLVPGAFIP
ncbi:MAG: VCBS repeat-containing protein [Acidobacteria bacterium]|nr:VCBS repeat-containing protein [Acidobacteriota bacterium]